MFSTANSYAVLDSVILSSLADNTLYEDSNGLISNGQGKFMFAGKYTDGNIRRAVLKFLPIESIPPCSRIVSATLTLHMSGGTNTSKTIQIRRLTEHWGEGSSNAPGLEETGTTAMSYDATWQHKYYSSDFWTNDGGTFLNLASQSAIVGSPGFYNWNSTPAMVNDVSLWTNDNSQNYGWILIGDETNNSSDKRFHTSEADTFSFVPQLKIVYEAANFGFYMESMIEGFWDGNTMVEDTLKVNLRNSTSPYSIIDSAKGISGQYGGSFCFFNASTGNYFIQVNHRNTIETWSKNPFLITIGNFEYYDFTDSATKAYGDNEVLKFNEWCFYSGDENQDGNIDVTDIVDIFNDVNNIVTGYVNTDVTGDNLVDVSDLLIAFNNSNNIVQIMRP